MKQTLNLRTRSIGLIISAVLILFAPGVSGARTVAAPNVARRATQEEVRGRVVDSAGAPIANAVVSLAELRLATKTAADGTFSFSGGPAGRYTLVARRVGYAASVRDVVVSGATEVTLRLAETAFQVEPVTVTATRSPTSALRSSLPTSSYTLLNFDIGIERDFLGRGARLEVGVRNAADVRYRSFLSRYKDFALEPGRNIIIRVSTDR